MVAESASFSPLERFLHFLGNLADVARQVQLSCELQRSHVNLRKLTKAPKLGVEPHTPPDILGCFVLVPAGGAH